MSQCLPTLRSAFCKKHLIFDLVSEMLKPSTIPLNFRVSSSFALGRRNNHGPTGDQQLPNKGPSHEVKNLLIGWESQ